ncbi:MAG: tripartite tricarboxylate transporter substrate binding protein [Pseudomonadota bacterium]|jgi:tripartite-type tricarboxylate transporter receptor subunit TctC|uniref:Bug family tripartite tricarboxylate transporter substrate binding protein n=1 Tax=Curvibacter delicatus TaxID=80879 RepID=UPI000831E1DA|nr:tripartite tricarboxylate transporter substrate binding protein [Curvibacter delicatus]MEA3394060.1 tripartite tricarboxylate transporter substrate binding protein [Pseudomonadota bacterium]
MTFTRRKLLTLTGSALALPCALAQPGPIWPSKPLKIVVAYPPGGVSDVIARALAEQLASRLGVPVLVDNKAGASGSLGVGWVAKSAADGYTLAFSAISPLTLSPHLGKSGFDPVKDIVPVASVMYSPVLITATSALKEGDLKRLLETARARPGAMRWATSGPASLGHVMLEQIRAAAHADITHVPYKGGGQQITDALSGQFEVLSVNTSSAILQHIKTGKLRPLAVGAPARLNNLPTVPTLAELGYPAANLSSHFGILAPAGTPAPVVTRLNGEINAVLSTPAIRERLLAAECVPEQTSPTEFAGLIAAESAGMARIIRDAQIKAE